MPPDSLYPLTSSQREIWFDQMRFSDVPLYNIGLYVKIDGAVDAGLFKEAVRQLAKKHDALRIRLVEGKGDDGLPMQMFSDPAPALFSCQDFSRDHDPDGSAITWMQQRFNEQFELYGQPLFRYDLVKTRADRYYLLVQYHHLIGDGWSVALLNRSLAEMYNSLSAGHPLDFSAPSYIDYINSNNIYIESNKYEIHKKYWLNKYQSLPEPLFKPRYKNRFNGETIPSGCLRSYLSSSLYQKLNAFAREHNSAIFHVIIGALYVYFARTAERQEVAMGLPVLNRANQQFKSTAGLFVGVCPARFSFGLDMEFTELLQHIAKELRSDYRHQRFPVSDLNKLLGMNKNGRAQLFDLNVNYAKHDHNMMFGQVAGRTTTLSNQHEQPPLIISFWEFHANEDVQVDFTYNLAYFTESEIEGLQKRFVNILEYILEHGAIAVQDIPLLIAREQQQLQQWNQTRVDFPREKTVIDQFELQVDKTPDYPAVVFADQRLSYKELNCRANQIGYYIKEQLATAGGDQLVGLCVRRSLDMITGLLAIMKAGAAYLPLDPDYPQERLQFMLEDSQVDLLLSQSDLARAGDYSGEIVCLDDSSRFKDYSEKNPEKKSGPDDLAYLIYTSGSTGRPKGTLLTHGGLLNLALAQIDSFRIKEESQVLQFASLGFDASVSEIMTALLSGATLHLVAKETLMSQVDFLSYMDMHHISHITLPPSYLAGIPHTRMQSLQTLVVAGEVCSRDLVKRWASRVYFLNAYGPSEATVCASVAHCSPDDGGTPSIGRPIANTRVYILAGDNQPQPIGIAGEICISGIGLARGYLNRPELTAEKFIEVEVFGQRQRLYKTGDHGCWKIDGSSDNGELEYLGRMDNQVKLRGFRIELDEIEVVIGGHPAVREAVVTIAEQDGRKWLAAHLVPADDKADLQTEILLWLKTRLPDHMVPATVTILDHMPLTPSGKIDRKALAIPDAAVMLTGYQAPGTGVEQQLTRIWSDLLNRSSIGIHDNFYDLGGDSIISIQIIARARQAGLGISPGDFFLYQTIAEQARIIKPVAEILCDQGLVQGEVGLTPIQARFFASDRTEFHHYNQAMLLTVPEDLQEDALQQAFAAILQHHDVLRLRYYLENGHYLQYHGAGDDILPFHIETVAGFVSENDHRHLVERATFWQSSLDLEQGPITRLVLFKSPTESRLLWLIHHLAVDGVSWHILLEDIQRAYQQAGNGKSITLPVKTSSFKSWSQQLLMYGNSPEFTRDADFWQNMEPVKSKLPLDYPQGSNLVTDTIYHTLEIDADTTRSLLEETPAAFRTNMHDLLTCALLLGLQEWTGHRQFIIDLESHGRTELFSDLDLSRTVGWFTALYTMALSLPEQDNYGTVIKAVKEQLRSVPDNGIGYGLLRQKGQDLAQGEILFNYLGRFDRNSPDFDFDFATETSGRSYSLNGSRDHLLEINGLVMHGRLSLIFSYSAARFQTKTIQNLADDLLHHLLNLLAYCKSHHGYTASDFPLLKLAQDRLDHFSQIYGQNIKAIYPLSPMQHGMLFHSLYQPDSGLYFEQLHFGLTGDLQLDLLQQAWQFLVDRHEILRTVFRFDADMPLQLVCKESQLQWTCLDWQSVEQSHLPEKLAALLEDERQQGFDYDQVPPLRFHLIQESNTGGTLVVHFHHSLMDGWCLPLLLSEFTKVYNGLQQGQKPQLPPVNSYQDYIGWLGRQDLHKAKNYWQKKLADFTLPTPLGIDHHSNNPPSYVEENKAMSREASQQLEKFARQQRVTLSTLVQAAWAFLLGRYSGEKDVVFGVTTSGRDVPVTGIENMLGLFINTLPMRVRLEGDLASLLHDLQHQQQQDNQYGYTALADIQSWSQVENPTPLFNSIVIFENYPTVVEAHKKSDQALQIKDISTVEYSNYPLTLAVLPGQQLKFRLSYDQNCFSREAIERLLEHLANLLTGMVEPETGLQQLPLLSVWENRQLQQWSLTRMDYPEDLTIVDLFEQQVRKTPDGIAVVFGEQDLSYIELNARVNRLAHFLLDSTGSSLTDQIIAICVERSVEMVVGILAILKAGGAYLPLDPAYPPERLQFMVTDGGALLLLSQKHLHKRIPDCKAYVYLDDAFLCDDFSAENPTRQSGPDDLASVIYTSGSTGIPKGVMLEHRGGVNLASFQQRYFNIGQESRVLQFSSMSFDAATWEMLMAFAGGGALCLVSREQLVENLQAVLQHKGITHATLPPSVADILAREDLPGLQYLIVAGEACSQHLVDDWADRVSFFNAYGPTEATVCASIALCHSNSGRPSIGQPIGNVRVVVLDSDNQLLPIGVPGELCIGGPGLARGYLNRPDITAEKFIETEIFGQQERLYRTGDLACWRADGNLEYLGRFDHQVKLRGFRVELGEIEFVLSQHYSVREVVVILRDDHGDKRLIAYLTLLLAEDDGVESELRQWLRDRLPEHMVPSTIMVLDHMPLTPNNKIDRKALPVPDRLESGHLVRPRTDTEALLATLWSSVLKISINNVLANFFDLGGHSLLVTQLISRIRGSFKVDVELSVVFEYPVLADLAAWLEKQQRAVTLPVIAARADDAPQVMSYGQQRLWFLSQLEGLSATYNMPIVFAISGQLDRAEFKKAAVSLVSRHTSLRLCFPEQDGEAVPRILDLYDPLTYADLSNLSGKKQQTAVRKMAYEHGHEPFDLSKGSLFKLQLLSLSDTEHILLFNIHHIISDGWSIGILMRELGILYKSSCLGQPAPLDLPVLQYPDYAAWQREWLQGAVLEHQLEYWRRQLADAPELLLLPLDFSRPPLQGFQGALHKIQVDAKLTTQLKDLSQKQGATLFMTLLASFSLLLHRYSGQDDILVGSPVANRSQQQTEDITGLFVNTLVLRSRFPENQSFTDLLQQVRQTALDGYAHQDIPFEQLVEAVNPERSLSHSPLFQAMFILQNEAVDHLHLDGLKVENLEPESLAAKFDITLHIREEAEGLSCFWEYATDLFAPERIQRMADHFKVLLQGIVASPDMEVGRLPLLTEQEARQLSLWNKTDTDYNLELTIIDLFEQQVERSADDVAIVFADKSLTYGELNSRANQVANYLLEQIESPQKDQLVAICVQRSLEMIVGLLAILKAGMAYVPLDPEYPVERLQFMLDDSQVTTVLTLSHLQDPLVSSSARLINLDDINLFIDLSAANSKVPVQPDDLAYVIYTSGSTGRPKGTLLSHKGFSNYLQWARDYYAVAQGSGAPVPSSLSFDGTITSIYLPLLSGRQIMLLPDKEEIEALAASLRQRPGFSFVKITPAHLEILNQQLDPGDYTDAAQSLILGGEALTAAHLYSWLQHAPETRLINEYGPTETVVGCCIYDARGETGLDGTVPIGRPIANTQIYILSKANQVQPVGVPGELCIAGPGLARGYLNRAELTAEKFVQVELFGKRQRLYKTGDLACWHPDGHLEYLGRLDHQIKLRGFRIEPGEIETVLSQHPAVREAIVVLFANRVGKRLVAYLTIGGTKAEATQLELSQWLKDKLPAHMVPATIIIMASLPLTSNGKVDRRKLPEPYVLECQEAVPPRTDSEVLLADLWTSVLNVEITDVNVDFFDLGGHSLIATRLVSRIRDSFMVDMELRLLFAYPVFSDLAHWLEQQQRQTVIHIDPLPEDASLVLSFAQQRLWFLSQLEGQGATYNMVAAFKISGQLNRTALEQALTHLVKRHMSLRLCFPEQDGQARVGILDLYTPLTCSDLSDLSPSEQQDTVQSLVVSQAREPFDLAQGPLFKLHLLSLNNEAHVLLFNMHHIISDGWSIGILVQELATLYEAACQGLPATLEPLTIQYPDYAAWQKEWLQGKVLQEQLDYWCDQLQGAPELLPLPGDYPRPPVQSYHGAQLTTRLEPGLSKKLTSLSQSNDVTLFMTMLAAFTVLLHRYSGKNDILVGSPIANRSLSQVENLIGLFVNTLVLRSQLDPEQSFTRLLQQVRQTALDAYGHQDIPFEQIVEALNPERSLSHSPLFQVMFVLNNEAPESLQLTGLEITPIEQENLVAKFDLTLSVEESNGGLLCAWEYSTDLFAPERIERLAEHFQILLEGIVADPDTALYKLPLLSQRELRQLRRWSQTPRDILSDQTLVDLFEQQVERSPDMKAVVFAAESLTYRELNSRANQMAHLLSRTVDPSQEDCLVGICVERSPAMLIGLLATLKAGMVCVPLDPDYPRERLEFMLQDSQASILLSQSHLSGTLPDFDKQLILIDDESLFQDLPSDNPSHLSTPARPAYVIYTSGSTGKPKGVVVDHKAIANHCLLMQSHYEMGAADRVLQFASFNFDASIEQIFSTLLAGASLYGLKSNVIDPGEMVEILLSSQITVADFPPAYWQQILTALDNKEPLSHLRLLILGGEPLSESLSHKTKQRFPTLRCLNAYGPTEAVITASTWELQTSETAARGSSAPVGRPVGDHLIYILDVNNQPSPIGIPGELCIGGAGLARGYLNRPGLTAEKFVELEIFGRQQRIYRSGDLARWREDGSSENGDLEYLGRLDHQLKLRGFRIEPGEIETVICQYEAVREAIVILYEEAERRRLVAYLTIGDNDAETIKVDLGQWLKEKLPAYMIPAKLIILDALPLTANGKTDRKGLPAPDFASSSQGFDKPVTVVEQQLAAIWSEVLRRKKISLQDNFFDLGGDSILTIQVIAKARKQGLGLKAQDLFQYQTLALLALAVRPISEVITEQGLLTGSVPLNPIQHRFFQTSSGDLSHYNQAVLLTVPGDLKVAALGMALAKIMAHHDALRLRYHRISSDICQQWYAEPKPDEQLQQEQLTDFSQLSSRLNDLQSSLDIDHGPLSHCVLFNVGADQKRLFWCIHHLAVDAVSWRILLEDLQTAYQQVLADSLVSLPDKSSSVRGWAERLQAWAESPDFAEHIHYWQNLPPETPPLPVDYPQGSVERRVGRSYETSLDQDLTRFLLEEAPAAYQTRVNDLLLTALMLTLRSWTGNSQHLVDLESHGRTLFNDIDLSRTVGWFTSLYCLYLVLPDSDDPGECLQEIKQQLQKVPDNGIGYGVLRYLKNQALPQGEILFNYLGQFDQTFTDSLFSLAEESSGDAISPQDCPEHGIEINSLVMNGQLSLTWGYSGEQYESQTIITQADNYMQELQGLIEHCRQQKPVSLNDISTVKILQDQGNHPPLFCLPGLVSSSTYFHSLASHLGPEQPVYVFEPPGLDGKTEIHTTVESLARYQAAIISQIQPEGPYSLLGHSFGGIVAVEVASLLEQQGQSIKLLAILDQPARKYSEPETDQDRRSDFDWLWDLVKIFRNAAGVELPFTREQMKAANNIHYCYVTVMHWLKQHHIHQLLFSPQGRLEELQALTAVYRANSLAYARYQPDGSTVKCAIDLFWARESQPSKTDQPSLPGDWGWSPSTRGGVSMHPVPGNHFSMLKDPYVQTTARNLNRLLLDKSNKR